MDNIDREKIRRGTSFKIFLIKMKAGIMKILANKKLGLAIGVILGLEILGIVVVSGEIRSYYAGIILGVMVSRIMCAILIFVPFLLNVAIIYVLATPRKAIRHRRGFQRIGLVNRAQQPPVLLIETIEENNHIFEYYANGIPWSKFDDEKEFIEAALNISIIAVYQGEDKTRVIIKAKEGTVQLPDYIEWSDTYLPSDSAEIVLGVSLDGLRVVDLNLSPHIQCGCSTGGGKTILLKCVLHQLYKNGAEIYLCDFKRFVDFPLHVREKYHCIDTKEQLRDTLDILIEEMEYRKDLFSGTGCANIVQYNKKYPNKPCQRIFLASDEIAFAFQKKGLPAEEKRLVEEIEAKMTLLCQQARFAGINIWLSTQRGDADTIPPQIRSNLTTRVCGRASEVLSRVTVDNSLASKIQEHQKGRFVDDNEQYFQAFYFEE